MWNLAVATRCIGSGVCAGTAPEHFAIGQDGKSHPLATTVVADDIILGAAASCPMEAILVTDAETGVAIDPAE